MGGEKKDNLCVSATFGKTLCTDGCIYYSMCEGCRGSGTIVFALEVAPRFMQVRKVIEDNTGNLPAQRGEYME